MTATTLASEGQVVCVRQRQYLLAYTGANQCPKVESQSALWTEIQFDSQLLHDTRCSATNPFFDSDEGGPLGRLPLVSPFHSAIQVNEPLFRN